MLREAIARLEGELARAHAAIEDRDAKVEQLQASAGLA